ncbi:MAG: hypothetical protein JSR46_06425 [Verrucomicrobia bacterium]|nr:hypothetical protein [Verrucomicrobiota bacterium]
MHISGQVPVSGPTGSGEPQKLESTYAMTLPDTLPSSSTTASIKPPPGNLSGEISKAADSNPEARKLLNKVCTFNEASAFPEMLNKLGEK